MDSAGLAALVVCLVLLLCIVWPFTGYVPRACESRLAKVLRRRKKNWGKRPFNFDEIDDGVLLGSLPRETANLEQLKQLGVSTIVNLNQQWELDVQPEEIRAAGLKLVWLQTPDYAAPTQGDIQIGVRAAQVGDHAGILVHAGLTNSACRKPSEAGARYTSTATVGEGGAQS